MSGILNRGFKQVAAVTGLARRGVVYFDYDNGDLIVPVQVSGAPNFEARGKTAADLKMDFDRKIGTSKTGYKVLGSMPNMARSMFSKKGGKSRKNRKTNSRKNRTRRN
jgi:hypothetical protein